MRRWLRNAILKVIPKNPALVDMDHLTLNNLAKDMGVIVKDSDYASFDLIKDLEIARNCLNKKQSTNNIEKCCDEIVEFESCSDQIVNFCSSDDDSDSHEMLLQQSREKTNLEKIKSSVSP